MDPAMILSMWNLFKNSPELMSDFIVWAQATQVFLAKVNAAQK